MPSKDSSPTCTSISGATAASRFRFHFEAIQFRATIDDVLSTSNIATNNNEFKLVTIACEAELLKLSFATS